MKDAAWVVAEDLTQGVAEDVLGAAEDGSPKVFIAARAICQRRNLRPTHACRSHAALGRHVKGVQIKHRPCSWKGCQEIDVL